MCVEERVIKLSDSVKQAPLESNLLVLLDIRLLKVMGAATETVDLVTHRD